MIGNPKEIHNEKAQEDEGDMDVSWDITSKDVERLRQFLTPTIHTLPNFKPVVPSCIPLGLVHDKDKIVREKEQDYDIPLNDSDPGVRRHLSRTDRLIIMWVYDNLKGTLLDPFQFSYPKRKLIMEEIVNKFIEEGKWEHEEIEAFIREFRTTNELLLKERNNSLSELEFKVYGLSRAINKA
ncbi:hypothetical protein Tco_1431214 [Tanacetum coccineum]